MISERGSDGHSEGHTALGLVGAVERRPWGRKKTLSLNGYLKKKGTSSWEKTGPIPWNIKSQETKTDTGPPGPPRGESRQSTGGRPHEQPSSRGRSGPALGGGPVRAGRAAQELAGTRGKSHRGPGAPTALPAEPHSPAHGPEPGTAAGVLRRNSVLGDHFRIQLVSRK